MTRLPVVHHPDYVTALPDGHRFPMSKFRHVGEILRERYSGQVTVNGCAPVSLATLTAVHDGAYVDRFINGALSDRAIRRMGLPWSEGLVTRTLTAVGGTVRTIQLALEHGLACNTAGGTHHASGAEGAGFCIFNDLAVGAHYALNRAEVDSVMIVDLDVHQGNGTAKLFEGNVSVTTFSLHCEANYPFSPSDSDRDVTVPEETGDEEYLETLKNSIGSYLPDQEPDLVIYDAGVDVHEGDKLGQLSLTDEGIRCRDEYVISTVRKLGIPMACVIGGGYDDDINGLADRHVILHESAITYLSEGIASSRSLNSS